MLAGRILLYELFQDNVWKFTQAISTSSKEGTMYARNLSGLAGSEPVAT